jgi:hypothetical protein
MSRPGNLSIKSGDGLCPDQLENKKAHFIRLERLVILVTRGSK